MRKLLITLLTLSLLLTSIPVYAAEEEQPELIKIRCTCYHYTGNPTKSGSMPYEGIVSSNYYYGKTLILYDIDKRYIGIFEVKDTGSSKSLKNGTSVDVYRDTLERCNDWISQYGDYVYIQVIEGAVG